MNSERHIQNTGHSKWQSRTFSFPELGNKVGRAPHRLLEDNAVKAAFDQARERKKKLNLFEDEEQNPMSMTIDGHPLKAMKSKVLTEETQPCVTSFWNKKKN